MCQKHHINMILRPCRQYQHKTLPFKGTYYNPYE